MPARNAIAMTPPMPGLMTRAPPALPRGCQSLSQYLRDLDPASLPRRENAGAHHRKRYGRVLTAAFLPALAAGRGGKLLQLLDQGIVAGAVDRHRMALAALEQTEPVVQIVVGGCILAVDVHQIVLGRRSVARIHRGKRTVLMFQDQARDIRIVAG